MKTLSLAALIPLLAVSCASHTGKKRVSSASKSAPTSSEERFNDWAGGMSKDNGFAKDAHGNLVPKSNKRSSFESKGQDPNFAGKDFQKTQYKAGDYAKKSFWGNKDFDRKAYAGSTDGSRFQKSSTLGEKGARESDSAADLPGDYHTANYTTNAARESGAGPVSKGSNDEIENRRDSYEQPGIIGWKEQRKMTVDQSTKILGP